MSEDSMTLELVGLVHRSVRAASSFEEFASFLAPDAVLDISPYGMGTYEGTAAAPVAAAPKSGSRTQSWAYG
jgi:hypothetical protein